MVWNASVAGLVQGQAGRQFEGRSGTSLEGMQLSGWTVDRTEAVEMTRSALRPVCGWLVRRQYNAGRTRCQNFQEVTQTRRAREEKTDESFAQRVEASLWTMYASEASNAVPRWCGRCAACSQGEPCRRQRHAV